MSFARLFGAIGTNWGVGSLAVGGTNDFNVPDLRAMFLRGVSGDLADTFADQDRDSRLASPSGGNSGNKPGSYQPMELVRHEHAALILTNPGRDDFQGFPANDNHQGFRTGDNGSGRGVQALGTLTRSFGGRETRPNNAYVHYIIKY